jgi:hypothetical protein
MQGGVGTSLRSVFMCWLVFGLGIMTLASWNIMHCLLCADRASLHLVLPVALAALSTSKHLSHGGGSACGLVYCCCCCCCCRFKFYRFDISLQLLDGPSVLNYLVGLVGGQAPLASHSIHLPARYVLNHVASTVTGVCSGWLLCRQAQRGAYTLTG